MKTITLIQTFPSEPVVLKPGGGARSYGVEYPASNASRAGVR